MSVRSNSKAAAENIRADIQEAIAEMAEESTPYSKMAPTAFEAWQEFKMEAPEFALGSRAELMHNVLTKRGFLGDVYYGDFYERIGKWLEQTPDEARAFESTHGEKQVQEQYEKLVTREFFKMAFASKPPDGFYVTYNPSRGADGWIEASVSLYKDGTRMGKAPGLDTATGHELYKMLNDEVVHGKSDELLDDMAVELQGESPGNPEKGGYAEALEELVKTVPLVTEAKRISYEMAVGRYGIEAGYEDLSEIATKLENADGFSHAAADFARGHINNHLAANMEHFEQRRAARRNSPVPTPRTPRQASTPTQDLAHAAEAAAQTQKHSHDKKIGR